MLFVRLFQQMINKITCRNPNFIFYSGLLASLIMQGKKGKVVLMSLPSFSLHATHLLWSCNSEMAPLLLIQITATILLFHMTHAAPQFSFLPLKFFGPVPQPLRIKFFPDDGLKYQKEFEEKYGVHGERLISMLGNGILNAKQNTIKVPQLNSTNFEHQPSSSQQLQQMSEKKLSNSATNTTHMKQNKK